MLQTEWRAKLRVYGRMWVNVFSTLSLETSEFREQPHMHIRIMWYIWVWSTFHCGTYVVYESVVVAHYQLACVLLYSFSTHSETFVNEFTLALFEMIKLFVWINYDPLCKHLKQRRKCILQICVKLCHTFLWCFAFNINSDGLF